MLTRIITPATTVSLLFYLIRSWSLPRQMNDRARPKFCSQNSARLADRNCSRRVRLSPCCRALMMTFSWWCGHAQAALVYRMLLVPVTTRSGSVNIDRVSSQCGEKGGEIQQTSTLFPVPWQISSLGSRTTTPLHPHARDQHLPMHPDNNIAHELPYLLLWDVGKATSNNLLVYGRRWSAAISPQTRLEKRSRAASDNNRSRQPR